jgi:hypothetical protein
MMVYARSIMMALAVGMLSSNASADSTVIPIPANKVVRYEDGRPAAQLKLDHIKDYGVVLTHGDGPRHNDVNGARDVWVFRYGSTFYMHYDAIGLQAWMTSLATSKDLIHWEKKGAILNLGAEGQADSKSASYGTTYFDGTTWHMFYLGSAKVSEPPNLVPNPPYVTMKAIGRSPAGPWTKQPDVLPFRPKAGTYYWDSASPGFIVKSKAEFIQFFTSGGPQTISIARTHDLNGPWKIDAHPIVPPSERIENSSLYYQKSTNTWFLFTNHVGIGANKEEFTDQIWAYWTNDLNIWSAEHKFIVLEGSDSSWSKAIVGLPSVLPVNGRLALFYDGLKSMQVPQGPASHVGRDIGLAWIDLPIKVPQ